MPNPTSSDVHVNAPLTNISTAFLVDQDKYISGKVFPAVRSQKQSNLYYTYDKGDFLRAEAAKRAPCTESRGLGYRMSTDSYFCDIWAAHKDVCRHMRANSDDAIDLDRDATLFTTQQMWLRKDIEWVSNFFNTGAWLASNNLTVGANWNTATGLPLVDLRTVMTRVHRRTGFRPNVAVFDQSSWDALVDNNSVLQRIQSVERGIVGTDLVASALSLDNVYVIGSVENTAAEGATDAVEFISGTTAGAWVGYVNPTPSLMQPSAGYTFVWSGLGGVNDMGIRINRFPMDAMAADRVEAEAAFDMKVVSNELGGFLDGML